METSTSAMALFLTMGLACLVLSIDQNVHGENLFPPKIHISRQNYLEEMRKMQGFKASFLQRDSLLSSPSPSPATAPAPAPLVSISTKIICIFF